ncbi:hypothetical protein HBDW_28440 [Herbaspirillum sp. DW155]|uniref:hypothetical protein n=1 Tax=Herbaspirillum sp. DW155 TaxID=3095609 RepID=UPI0030920CD0|nr:hypothetical protein HBDW_28440 [Herbaspirillum sp. DW155]
MDQPHPDPVLPRHTASPQAPAAALLRPPGLPPAPPRAAVPDHIETDPAHGVEPDGTEDPLANADDGILPHPAGSPSLPPAQENTMHKPQDTPPVEVPPLDPTPPLDPIPHQNPVGGQR